MARDARGGGGEGVDDGGAVGRPEGSVAACTLRGSGGRGPIVRTRWQPSGGRAWGSVAMHHETLPGEALRQRGGASGDTGAGEKDPRGASGGEEAGARGAGSPMGPGALAGEPEGGDPAARSP